MGTPGTRNRAQPTAPAYGQGLITPGCGRS